MNNQIIKHSRQVNRAVEGFKPPQGIHHLTMKKAQPSGANKKGKVLLVGAGPNDPELLTIKAYQAIQKADVVVFDRLVGHEILDLIPEHCEQIYVGKRCGQPSLKQEEINQILIEQAEQGKQVVRLKGGDPFIFGRGGEEALALIAQGIQYDVIPGITAAIGCAASAKIPLTHRGVSRSVTLVTGRIMEGEFNSWSGLVSSGQTVVFYMGLEQANSIQQGLLSSGLASNTPVAIIGNGCSAKETTYITTLDELPMMAISLKGLTPALIVVGEVVALRDELIAELQENAHLPL
ncbi:uroporphyrinogen-III C-methyltransferase [Vibrio sp. CK2-1]|uniref:uroporphyrinogen-III C-methyltransferase n=1 Tax=Vibrio sp. CK2-1 TaxID=2912249 RepID=UPI001F015A6F|nr:uroporphyrinogen-III C-methyltransferase [Vibrio sp. CK2-1]MCF7352691.1 uroporphyrinogen-III C-methyltransferase [Vibrio sp. CK2-1]